jgi:hypothetical protein
MRISVAATLAVMGAIIMLIVMGAILQGLVGLVRRKVLFG